MRSYLVSAASLLTLAVLPAQDPIDASAPSMAEALFQRIDREFRDASNARTAKVREITKGEEYLAARKERNREKMRELTGSIPALDTKPFVVEFQEAAEKFAGTDDAIPFLEWLAFKSGDQAAQKSAAITVISDHVESAKIGKFVEMLPYYADTLKIELGPTLDAIIEDSPHDAMKAYAYNARANRVLRDKNADEAAKAAAAKDLEMATKLSEGTLLGMRLRGPKFAEENLQVGMTAPDIVGEDLDGVEFKLSDYRGKVVVLDFWGDW